MARSGCLNGCRELLVYYNAQFRNVRYRVRMFLEDNFNFVTLHYVFFLALIFPVALIFWARSKHDKPATFTNSLYLVVSAATQTGLNPLDLSTLSHGQQAILFLLMYFGSSIFVSLILLTIRKREFKRKFREVITDHEKAHEAKKQKAKKDITVQLGKVTTTGSSTNILQNGDLSRSSYLRGTRLLLRRDRVSREAGELTQEELNNMDYPKYLTRRNIGHNGQFFLLSHQERGHLGGVEYRAICVLQLVVMVYYIVVPLLGMLALGPWLAHYRPNVQAHVPSWWLAAFNCVSAFTNTGMSLADTSMTVFGGDPYPLAITSILILLGNTCFPIALRSIIWFWLQILLHFWQEDHQKAQIKATLRYILAYPRRIYTHMFPSTATRWLFGVVISMNLMDWMLFELTNIGNKAIKKTIPSLTQRVGNGLYQAIAIRTCGFVVLPLGSTSLVMQFICMIMMYVSIYPVVITMRHSNVYEERSLGIYADDETPHDIEQPRPSFLNKLRSTVSRQAEATLSAGGHRDFIHQQLRRQLAHDIMVPILATFVILWNETSNIESDTTHSWSGFNIMFEVITAYGVGLSLGLPNVNYSFSGDWRTASKTILTAVMIWGRHRGLPVALDRAVRLPGSGTPGQIEEDDHKHRETISVIEAEIRKSEGQSRSRSRGRSEVRAPVDDSVETLDA